MRNVELFVVGPAGSEVAAVLAMMLLVGFITAPLALFADAPVTANGKAPTNPCAAQIAANSTTQTANQVKVSDASGQGDSLDVYSGRAGAVVQRVSTPLSVQNGLLPPNLCLGTVVSDLVRSDGEVIPSDQVTSWAMSGNAGLRVFIYLEVSPRYGSVTQAGGYTGTVSMDDERAVGGNIPVNIHVEYPRLWRATMVCIVAAWVGFFWAWLIHLTRADIPSAGRFWLYIILQFAILTIVSFPVLNAQILTNPDWTGDISHYIALASLAGGGALATTPTLRALVDRAAIFMPGASPATSADLVVPPASPATTPQDGDGGAPAASADSDGGTPAAPADSALTTPAGGDGSSLTPTDSDAASPAAPTDSDGASLTTPAGGDGASLTTPADSNGGSLTTPADSDGGTPATPADSDGGTPATPADSDSGTPATPADSDSGTPATPADSDGSSPTTPTDSDGGTPATPTPAPTAPTPAPTAPTASSDSPGS